MAASDRNDRDDRDSPWKEALERYLDAALQLLFPAAHAEVDWARRWEALDGELQQVVRDAELGRRLADKLFKVHRRCGGEVWIVLHVEVQGQVDPGLPARIRLYRNRIHDRYDRPVACLVVLADEREDWRPAAFQEEVLGTRERLEFPTAKLIDFVGREAELFADPNPFGLVVLAHLASLRTRKDPQGRLQWKVRLVRSLYERGYEREDVLELFRFLDWLLGLPLPQEEAFAQELSAIEKERAMPYRMDFEVKAEARGEARGEEKGQRAALRALLEARFGELPRDLAARLDAITGAEVLDRLVRRAAVAATLDEVLAALDDPPRP
ncbi:MAG: hypothetical protein KIT58_04835 [Planctomycetota bacterium]|nr:hypothetical protein [Planctomycetota bacterium]